MTLAKFLRLLNTIRYLKFRQILYRLINLFYKGVLPSKSLSLIIRKHFYHSIEFISHDDLLVGPKEFVFLNKKGDLNHSGWESEEMTKLWLYNLHYFDFLISKTPGQRDIKLDLLLNWVANNKPGKGVGWEPYPSSLRIVNWIKWALSGNTLPNKCIDSLAFQSAWLNSRIEYHLMGNHLFSNAKALIFAGCFFAGKEANHWFNKGIKIVSVELKEQVLEDGGNFELSPMYHAIFLEDLLDLINLSLSFPNMFSAEVVETWRAKASKMTFWMKSMIHPDGDIALFNDAALGIAPKPEKITNYAQSLGVDVPSLPSFFTHLESSGYLRLEDQYKVLIIDAAKVGPDYLPGHAHADTLSFELSLFNERVFVNGGTSEYESGDIRQFERSTAAHNTVVVNQQNSSEVWASFRVARRAYPVDLKIKQSDNETIISCSHNGYERLSRGLRHNREWRSSKKFIEVNDFVKGNFSDAYAYYHLSPDIDIKSIKSSKINLITKKKKAIQIDLFDSSFEILEGFYSPEFGKRMSNKCLKLKLNKILGASLRVSWEQ